MAVEINTELFRLSQHAMYFPDGELCGIVWVESDFKNKVQVIFIVKSTCVKATAHYGHNWKDNSVEGQTFLLWLKRRTALPLVGVYLAKQHLPDKHGNYAKFKDVLIAFSQTEAMHDGKTTVLTFEDCEKCDSFALVDLFRIVDNQEKSIENGSSSEFVITCNNRECV